MVGFSKHLTIEQQSRLLEKFNGRCWYCGIELITTDFFKGIPSGATITVPNRYDCTVFDHVVPRRRGGTNHESNLVPCCNTCNATKKDKTLEEFRAYRASQTKTQPFLFYAETSSQKEVA